MRRDEERNRGMVSTLFLGLFEYRILGKCLGQMRFILSDVLTCCQ